uniref:Uncharacterized protein n=1 Tax=Salix viminalis TaxID=40686 RepID=A0A6N2LZR0_SALVM
MNFSKLVWIGFMSRQESLRWIHGLFPKNILVLLIL